jgi:hypothetical protein
MALYEYFGKTSGESFTLTMTTSEHDENESNPWAAPAPTLNKKLFFAKTSRNR